MEHYISQQKNQLLDSLENQVRFSQLVAIVVGDKGVGKSFLLMELQSRLEQEVLTARVDASLSMTEDQLDKTLSLQLGLSWQDSEVALEQRIKNDLNQKVLIAIDDAHRLSSSCLNFILRLNQKQLEFRESVIFILLAGDNSLPALIKETDTYSQHQDMCVVFPVEPVEQSETQALIAAMSPDPLISANGLYEPKKLDYFWQLSKGNPAELNYHVSRWIAEQSSSPPSEVIVEESASYFRSFYYLLVAIILMSVLVFQDEINRFISSSSSAEKDPEAIENIAKTIDVLREVNKANESKDLGSEKSKIILDKSQTHRESSQKKQANNDKTSDEKVEIEEPLRSKSQVTNSKNSISKPSSESNGSDLGDTKIKTASPKVGLNKDGVIDSGMGNRTDTNAREVSQKTIAEANYLTEDEQELLLLADSHYLLQWLALSGKDAANQYVEKHQFNDTMKIYRRDQPGSDLFLIVSGDFSSRDRAKAAKQDYENTGILERPWIKSIKAVKNEIKAFQKSNK